MKNFIMTQDEDTANELMKLGYNLVTKSGNSYTFENCKNLSFSKEINTQKIIETNMLCM